MTHDYRVCSRGDDLSRELGRCGVQYVRGAASRWIDDAGGGGCATSRNDGVQVDGNVCATRHWHASDGGCIHQSLAREQKKQGISEGLHCHPREIWIIFIIVQKFNFFCTLDLFFTYIFYNNTNTHEHLFIHV